MTPDQLDLLSEMIVNKLFAKLEPLIKEKGYTVAFEPIPPQEFIDKNVDAFGNVRFTQKDILGEQLEKLKSKADELLKDEKYELLQELKEIYDKIKKDYDNL
jgi:hypothetical protein|tara:strand:+ start:2447 stop:2752 length:306 start_codon:yes stop_codon:yes gene_type:complete